MQRILSVIVLSYLTIIIPGTVMAVDEHYSLFASLRGKSLSEILSTGDFWLNQPEPVAGNLLVATRHIKGSLFSRAVVLILSHDIHGSTGLIINLPSHENISNAFPGERKFQLVDEPVYIGGPVNLGKLYILIQSESPPPNSQQILDDLYLSTSLKTFHYLSGAPERSYNVRICAGYAGWRPGQLASEVASGSWHVMTGSAKLVFGKDPEGLWKRLIRKIERRQSP